MPLFGPKWRFKMADSQNSISLLKPFTGVKRTSINLVVHNPEFYVLFQLVPYLVTNWKLLERTWNVIRNMLLPPGLIFTYLTQVLGHARSKFYVYLFTVVHIYHVLLVKNLK